MVCCIGGKSIWISIGTVFAAAWRSLMCTMIGIADGTLVSSPLLPISYSLHTNFSCVNLPLHSITTAPTQTSCSRQYTTMALSQMLIEVIFLAATVDALQNHCHQRAASRRPFARSIKNSSIDAPLAFVHSPTQRMTHVISSSITTLHASVDVGTTPSATTSEDGIVSPSLPLAQQFLTSYEQSLEEGQQWANEFGFADGSEGELSSEGAFYSIFRAFRKMDHDGNGELLGLDGTPFYIPSSLLKNAESEFSSKQQLSNGGEKNAFTSYFNFQHLATALEEDFLDAQRGSTDNRKGWQVSAVSQPTGSSFDDARMTLPQVQTALTAGTVIFNNIGAHIPRLAGPTLACTDALSLPGALNMYVTAKGMRTSAPPHTDRQDVVVIQMEGAKRWRIFTPPTDGEVKPTADPFARGKGDDSLPLHTLLEGKEGRLGTELLMDVVSREGDVLFIPAGFPHTTDTVEETTADKTDSSVNTEYDTSIHLTFNIDTHVWDLDYLNVRNVAMRRNGVRDVLLPSLSSGERNRYVGNVNKLPSDLRSRLMDALPLDFLDLDPRSNPDSVNLVVKRVEELAAEVDNEAATISSESFREALNRVHEYSSKILDIHRDMYLAAIEEGRLRKSETAMTAHLKKDVDGSDSPIVSMTPERIQRLSLFRVRPFFEAIDVAKKDFERWCVSEASIAQSSSSVSSSGSVTTQLDSNWQYTSPLKVGDEVEADLGGAFFAAKVSQVVGNTYNVVFFDGDRSDGLSRDQVKLLTPPKTSDEIDTTGLTPKEIKRLKKKMEKKQRK